MRWRREWQPTPVFLLENPRDRGAWWAAICGVAQSWTRLKWLSSSSGILLYIYTYIYPLFFIQSSVDGHLTIMNNAPVNTGIHESFWISVFEVLDMYPLWGHMVVLFSDFWEVSIMVSIVHQFTFPPTVYKDSFFSAPSPTLVICVLFGDSHSDRCEVIRLCGFDLHFHDD